MLASVESIGKFDNSALAFDCSDEAFRSIEASLNQVLHRTTANEPLRMLQQTRGQRGFEAWHATVRRYDQSNTSDKNSAYAALISNISEKDRARDVEQFDDILRMFTNEMNNFESRFGKIRDEEMLAVKKLIPESLLNYRFRGTTMSYSELIIALENISVDMVSTVPSSKRRRNDTSAPMKIGMAAKGDGENVSQEGDQRIMNLALQAVQEGTGKGQEKGGKGETRTFWTSGKTGHIAAWCRKGGNKNLFAVDEDDSENVEESAENEEDLQAWCLLEESENEQWQEVICRRDKQRAKNVNPASLLSVESSHSLSPKKIVEVTDKWVKLWSRRSSDA